MHNVRRHGPSPSRGLSLQADPKTGGGHVHGVVRQYSLRFRRRLGELEPAHVIAPC